MYTKEGMRGSRLSQENRLGRDSRKSNNSSTFPKRKKMDEKEDVRGRKEGEKAEDRGEIG